ncbi:hypothetical protein PUNSTDRAFT_48006 [Punctularia strigosozonata HHB-11173 SS5]|uniref:Uncharacterized protein n=1 Tax=Punctularia strigosozonata (strain HHB-11173) TaxID=741275 RepID=R7S158_PUNST|nr:uncharacterized protein PUNSTDRAFT_48006 [Punctularia strigosozonata HHB-11173 SS5]EIN03527.1 hypothetical protein PUNSTDRAFT_48006 [Punctularia strigosozonata HHB-11173 SS5]
MSNPASGPSRPALSKEELLALVKELRAKDAAETAARSPAAGSVPSTVLASGAGSAERAEPARAPEDRQADRAIPRSERSEWAAMTPAEQWTRAAHITNDATKRFWLKMEQFTDHARSAMFENSLTTATTVGSGIERIAKESVKQSRVIQLAIVGQINDDVDEDDVEEDQPPVHPA